MANPTAGATGHLAAHGLHPCYINHGSTASTARPLLDGSGDAATVVYWVGSVAPTHAATDDLWWNSAGNYTARYTGTAWAVPAGTELAVTNYNPSSIAQYSFTTATYVDVDATNAAVTFTAPASGNVRIEARIPVNIGDGVAMNVNLRNGTTNVTNTDCRVAYWSDTTNNASIASQGVSNLTFQLTGLTPGTSYTYKLGAQRVVGSQSCNIQAGGATWGPLLIKAIAAT